MRTHLTYWHENGAIWRWANCGGIRAKFEPVYTSLTEAKAILAQCEVSAETPDYYRRRAAELRDEMADAIQEYEQFQQPNQKAA